jgi:hypothetical protein
MKMFLRAQLDLPSPIVRVLEEDGSGEQVYSLVEFFSRQTSYFNGMIRNGYQIADDSSGDWVFRYFDSEEEFNRAKKPKRVCVERRVRAMERVHIALPLGTEDASPQAIIGSLANGTLEKHIVHREPLRTVQLEAEHTWVLIPEDDAVPFLETS